MKIKNKKILTMSMKKETRFYYIERGSVNWLTILKAFLAISVDFPLTQQCHVYECIPKFNQRYTQNI